MLFPIFQQENALKKASDELDDKDRIKFIKNCNKVDKELETMLTNYITQLNQEQLKVLKEKKEYVNSIRNIVNDLGFKNKAHFMELYKVLKEIQYDMKLQNKDVTNLEKVIKKDTQSKDELVNMLVHRMMYDSSKRTLKNPETLSILGDSLESNEDNRKLLEKYIVKTIRKQLRKELNKSNEESQDMNVLENEQLKRKLDLIESTINKLSSMENLYEKVHSVNPEQRRRIITLVNEPIKKSIRPLIVSKCKQKDTKVVDDNVKHKESSNMSYKANTIYITE